LKNRAPHKNKYTLCAVGQGVDRGDQPPGLAILRGQEMPLAAYPKPTMLPCRPEWGVSPRTGTLASLCTFR